jgi:Leucine-rich repeat (LRR) protein
MWPTYNQCKLNSVDLSENLKTVDHTFTGTPAQKSAATVVWFDRPSNIVFLPKQILNNFPQLDGLEISYCDTLTVVKNDLFAKDFRPIQILVLHFNKISTIEADAFEHLTQLKWISLGGNQIQTLPHQLFKNNPDLFVVWLDKNKINSITPDFFKGLNKLKHVTLQFNNQCSQKVFGCSTGSCSVTQSELDSGLSTCYANCLNDNQCAPKSEKLVNSCPTETNKIEEMSQELRALSKEVADLKIKLEESKDITDLERKLSEIFKKEFDDFVNKLNSGA